MLYNEQSSVENGGFEVGGEAKAGPEEGSWTVRQEVSLISLLSKRIEAAPYESRRRVIEYLKSRSWT